LIREMHEERSLRAGRPCFLLLALAGAGFVAVTLPRLPAPMAVHFDLYGRPDGWAGRGVYVALLGTIGMLLPLAIVWFTGRLGRDRPELLNVPGRDYWFAPERRAEGRRRLANQMWWLACLMLALVIALHGVILLAHSTLPPRLPLVPFLALLVGFVFAVVAWGERLGAALRVPPGPASRV
jgi:uncharacterized membrane protein